MPPTIPLDTIYTAAEAAKRLRLTNRGVIKLGKEYGLCSRSGRNYLFSESDLLALWQVLREPPKVPKLPTAKAHVSDLRLYEAIQKLTAKRKGPVGRNGKPPMPRTRNCARQQRRQSRNGRTTNRWITAIEIRLIGRLNGKSVDG